MPRSPHHRSSARRPLTLAEQIDQRVDELNALRPVAADARRPHGRTEDLLEGLEQVGLACRRMARGGR